MFMKMDERCIQMSLQMCMNFVNCTVPGIAGDHHHRCQSSFRDCRSRNPGISGFPMQLPSEFS